MVAVGDTRRRPVGPFLLLVTALALPLWALGALLGGELMPGLPLAALQFVVPVVAASLLVYRREGRATLGAFLRRAVDGGRVRGPAWWLVAALLHPLLWTLSWLLMDAMGRPLPPLRVPLASLPALAAAFLVAGLAEELGWMGYAYGPLEERWGALRAALGLGVFWAAWHVVPLITGGREGSWIAWWALGTVAMRVLHVWLFENTGRSVLAQAVLHASFNLSWQLFPVRGSAYDPAVLSPLIALAAVAVSALPGSVMRRRAAAHGQGERSVPRQAGPPRSASHGPAR